MSNTIFNMIKRKCDRCGSYHIVKSEGILEHCSDCGHVLNQRAAAKRYRSEINEYY